MIMEQKATIIVEHLVNRNIGRIENLSATKKRYKTKSDHWCSSGSIFITFCNIIDYVIILVGQLYFCDKFHTEPKNVRKESCSM